MKKKIPVIGVGAVIVHQNRVLLVKRKNDPGKGFWAIPGGKIKYGESLKSAVERELYEETGIRIKALEPIHIFEVIPGEKQNDNHFHYVIIDYSAEYLSGIIKAADDAEEAAWFNPEAVSKLNLHPETYTLLVKKMKFVN